MDAVIHISLKLLPSTLTSKVIKNRVYLIDKRTRMSESKPALIVFIVILKENRSSLTMSLTLHCHTQQLMETAPTTLATETRLHQVLNIAKSASSNPRCLSGWLLLTKVFQSHFLSPAVLQSIKPSMKLIV